MKAAWAEPYLHNEHGYVVELTTAALLHRHSHEELTAILGENRFFILEIQRSLSLARFSLHFLTKDQPKFCCFLGFALLRSQLEKTPWGFKYIMLSLTKMWWLKVNIVHAMNYS